MDRSERRRQQRTKKPVVVSIPEKAAREMARLDGIAAEATRERDNYVAGVLAGMGVEADPQGPWRWHVDPVKRTVTRVPRVAPVQ